MLLDKKSNLLHHRLQSSFYSEKYTFQSFVSFQRHYLEIFFLHQRILYSNLKFEHLMLDIESQYFPFNKIKN